MLEEEMDERPFKSMPRGEQITRTVINTLKIVCAVGLFYLVRDCCENLESKTEGTSNIKQNTTTEQSYQRNIDYNQNYQR